MGSSQNAGCVDYLLSKSETIIVCTFSYNVYVPGGSPVPTSHTASKNKHQAQV